MNKIYIVTAGEYSDYHIEAVFSNLELAEECKEKFNQTRSYRKSACVEEYALDEKQNEKLRKFWETRLDIKTGEIINEEEVFEFDDYESSSYSHSHKIMMEMNSLSKEIYARSYKPQEHARKLAIEERQKFFRTYQITPDSLIEDGYSYKVKKQNLKEIAQRGQNN